MTIFLVPSPGHATDVKTPVEGAPAPIGDPLPTWATLVGRYAPAPGRVESRVGARFPAGNVPRVPPVPRVGLKRPGRGGATFFPGTPTTTFNLPARRGTTGVAGNGPHEPGPAIMVGAWFLAGNAPRGGLRPLFSGRCRTGRRGAIFFPGTPTTMFDSPVGRGNTGVVGNGINEKYERSLQQATSYNWKSVTIPTDFQLLGPGWEILCAKRG